jgi:hypothetical protein
MKEKMKTTFKFYSLLNKILFASLSCNLALAPITANAAILNASAGGTFTFNYDSAALGQYVYGGANNNNGYYLANFWNTAASDPYNPNNTKSHFASSVGTTQIPAANLVHDVTPIGSFSDPQVSGRHVQGTSANFAVDSNTLTGQSGAQLGMTGVQSYRLPNYPAPYNYILAGDFSLAYDPSARASAWTGQTGTPTGWYIQNNLGFSLVTYDLTNLSLAFTDANNWKLGGNLLMSPDYADMLAGPGLMDVGTFNLSIGSYAVSSVPLPATVWIFLTGLVGLMAGGRRKIQA